MATLEQIEQAISARQGLQQRLSAEDQRRRKREFTQGGRLAAERGEPLTTTLPVARPQDPFVADPAGPMVLDPPRDRPELVFKAASAGVVANNPAPSGSALASLAFDTEERRKAFEISLRRETGTDVPVRIGPETREIEYFDAERQRFSLAIDPEGQDFGALAGFGISLGPGVAAGVTTAFFTRNPLFVNAAASGGDFVGEVARLSLGRLLGINQEVSDEQIIAEGAKVAGLAFLAGKIGDDVLRLGKFVIDAASGRVLDRRALENVAVDADVSEAAAVAKEINEQISGGKLRFNLAQASNDEDLLVMQESFKKNPQFSKDFRVFGEQQQTAVREFFEVIHKPFRSRMVSKETGRVEVGSRVQSVARDVVEGEKLPFEISVAQAREELENIITTPVSRTYESVGRVLRETGGEEHEAFRLWSREAADALHNAAGGSEFIENSATVDAVEAMSGDVRDALFPITQRGTERLLPSRMRPLVDPDTGKPLQDPQTGEVIEISSKVFDPGAKFTFNEAWEAISGLKAMVRVAAKGLSTEEPSVGAVKGLITALESDLRTSAHATSIGPLYDEFITKYAIEKGRLDRGVAGAIMERRGGGQFARFVISDEKVFNEVMTEPRAMTETLDLVRNDPEAIQGLREGVVDFYKRTVVQDGRVNAAAHNSFLDRFGGVVRAQTKDGVALFSKQERAFFSRAGNAEKVLKAREGRLQAATAEINKSFEAQIVNLRDPSQVMSLIWDANNPSKAARVMALLERRNLPDVARAVRAEVKKTVAERVMGEFRGGERVVNFKKLGDFLDGKSGEAGHAGLLRTVFDDAYVKNLQLLRKGIEIAEREPQFPNRSQTAFWIDTVKNLSRAYVGLFTRPGRFITALDRLRGRAANRVIARALLNPEELKDLTSLRGVDLRSRKAAVLLGNLGGSALLSPTTGE